MIRGMGQPQIPKKFYMDSGHSAEGSSSKFGGNTLARRGIHRKIRLVSGTPDLLSA